MYYRTILKNSKERRPLQEQVGRCIEIVTRNRTLNHFISKKPEETF